MKVQAYSIFKERLYESAKRNKFPLWVMFELTYRCNFFCKHCYVPKSYRKKKELKTDEVFFVLDKLKSIGCFYLGFTGGEVFMRKDIMQILWYAKKKGFEIIIYSNGSLIDKKMADALSKLRPNKVDVTIPGISKTVFERVSGVAGSRDKVFKAIDWLNKKKVNLGFKSCVLKENVSEIEKVQEFAASLGALHRLDDILLRRLDGSGECYDFRNRVKIPIKKLLGRDCNCNSSWIVADSFFKCGAGISQAAITPQGELKICLMIDYIKQKIALKEESGLTVAWNKLRERVELIKPDEKFHCDKCNLAAYCKWCPAKGWLFNKNFSACDQQELFK